MVVKEITFGDTDPNPGLVLKALEVMGLEGRSSLKGPVKQNGRVVGCLVRFHDDADADKFLKAWNGFLELRKKGGPAFGLAPMYAMPTLPLRVSMSDEGGIVSPPSSAPDQKS
jgi:hypothetical protein